MIIWFQLFKISSEISLDGFKTNIKIANIHDIDNDFIIISRMGISNPGIIFPLNNVMPAISIALKVWMLNGCIFNLTSIKI